MYLLTPDDRMFTIDSSLIADTVLQPTLQKQIFDISYRADTSGDAVISDLFFITTADSLPVCLIGRSIQAGLSSSPGLILLEIPSDGINRIMLRDNSRIGLGASGEAYIIGNDYLMRSSSRFIRNAILRIPVRSLTAIEALKGGNGAGITPDYRGIPVFSAYEPLDIPGLKWNLLAEIDYEEAMVPVASLRNDILIVSLILSIFILGISQLISKMITQPVFRLRDAASRLGRGELGSKVTIGTGDEIESLADAFNTMSDQLRAERMNTIRALYDGQEMERRRVSMELHDGLGQKLVGAKLQIENCSEEDAGCLARTMKETKAGLLGIIEELRRISNDLMPATLDEFGLETALRTLCAEVGKNQGVEVEFEAEAEALPSDFRAVYLFRIAQEAIQNTLKHAGATIISIQLLETRDSLILILEDNGKGFEPDKQPRGNGLPNMTGRAILMGGTLSVESEPGKGTTVRVKIPKAYEPENQGNPGR
jgi:signal transduction histidine kinase